MDSEKSRFIDVSHRVVSGQATYPGLPAPNISEHLSREASRSIYAPGTEFHIGKIEMVANTGTYLDAPFHRFGDEMDISLLPLESIADLEGVVLRVDARYGRSIGPEVFEGRQLAGKAVLVHTGWSAHWGSGRYFEDHPFLTGAAARYLIAQRASLVGIDSLNIDDTRDARRPVHTLLLEHRIPIVEHLTRLDQLPEAGFRFFAVPAKVQGMGSFPVRAFGIVRPVG